MTIVLVDVDGTLVDAPSCERLFVTELLKTGIIGPRQCAAALWFPVRWAPRYGRHVLKKNKAYLAGLTRDRVASAGETFARRAILPRLRQPLIDRIEAHRANGDTVALLTGTPDFLAEPIAQALGITHWSATRCTISGGRFTADPPLAHPFRSGKLVLANELCRRLGGRLDASIAYADSEHDVMLLRAVRRAVAVAPDAGLRAAAEREGWEIFAA